MKTGVICAMFFCVLIAPALSGCNLQKTEPVETTSVPVGETTITPTEETGYEGLGLTDEEIRLLEDRGVANVESVEVASKIAGFTVAVPSYVPNSFTPGKFMIDISGAGMPSGMSVKFNNTKVERTYSHNDGKTLILIIQSAQKLSVGGSEPADLCGQTAERKFTERDPDNPQTQDKLIYGWEKDGFYFAVTGILTGNLDEAELIKVACSITVE